MFKNGAKIHELKDFDICSKIQKPSLKILKGFLSALGVPKTCNITKNQTICFKDSIIAKISLSVLEMIAKPDKKATTVKMVIDHDTGKSCFDAQYNVVKLK